MINKEIIIFLIKQDMIHNRLVMGLEKLGLTVASDYDLEIMNKVTELMGVENGIAKENWCNRYLDFRGIMYTSCQIGNWQLELNELAEKCFNKLVEESI